MKKTGKAGAMTLTSVCVVGATGKFGRTIISSTDPDIKITGAVCSDTNPMVGKPLSSIGCPSGDIQISGASEIEKATTQSDVVLFVSKPAADLANIPRIISLHKKIVVGTTGFDNTQRDSLQSLLNNTPSVIAANFAVGANILFKISQLLSNFSELYDYSIVEYHHKSKTDAPSGTAKTMLEMLNSHSSFPSIVTDRTVKTRRMPGEVEMLSIRGGGTPGIHQLILSGEHDMITVEHIAFSRYAASVGALSACKWITSVKKPGIYSMQDVLGLSRS